MPYDSNGNASLVPGYFVQNGDDVLPSQHNPPLEDIANMLSQALLRDGRAPMSGNLNFNGNKATNLAAPTNPNDGARLTDIASGAAKLTIYSTAGNFTHTFDTKTKKFQVEGSGGGGAGASCNVGTFGETYFGAGGHSGWHYTTDILDKGLITAATLVIGAAGTSTPANPINGGNTTYTDGVNSFTWVGGLTPPSLLASGTGVARIFQYSQTSGLFLPRARFGFAGFGSMGISYAGTGVVLGGKGGDTPYGQGGAPVTSVNSNGNAGNGNGSGGSGSVKASGTPGFNGGSGAPGIIKIWEW